MRQITDELDVFSTFTLAGRNARILHAMSRAEKIGELGHCPIMCSLYTGVRSTGTASAADVVAKRINLKTFAAACGDGRSSDARGVRANVCRKKRSATKQVEILHPDGAAG